ncbi:hypothetical protein BOTBODRAFT_492738 [Botryobasidium botryosum FD-172 SS1]|uniref:Secreted protein n=1 Tax=Botryobasidium botryosum (strain FD-172 SS1) TaxID=930990 RepID=A0A067MFZ3_BOTB1|nr:hypothetical protein BOTBODRAFT_492738 [Botryobasidium botryosum FD-172 SS1]
MSLAGTSVSLILLVFTLHSMTRAQAKRKLTTPVLAHASASVSHTFLSNLCFRPTRQRSSFSCSSSIYSYARMPLSPNKSESVPITIFLKPSPDHARNPSVTCAARSSVRFDRRRRSTRPG